MPTLDTKSTDWMARFTGGESLSDAPDPAMQVELSNIAERRQAMRERQYWTDLIEKRAKDYEARLVALRNTEVKQRGKKRKVVSTTFDLEAWEASEETEFPPGTKELIDEVEHQLDQWKVHLENQYYTWSVLDGGVVIADRRPLFDTAQIGEVLYSPLVRRVLYPDGLVPLEYSFVGTNLKGSMDMYLADEELEYSKVEEMQECAKLVGDLVKSLADVAGAGAGLSEAMDTISGDTKSTIDTIVLVTKSVTDLTVTGFDVIPKGKEGIGTGLDKAFDVVGSTVASTMKIWDPTNESIGKAVPTAISLGCKAAGRLSKGIADTVTSDNVESRADAIMNCIAEQIAIGFSAAGSATEDDSLKILFSTLSTGSAKLIKPDLWKSLAKAIESGEPGDWSAFATGVAGTIGEIVQAGITTHLANQKSKELDREKNPKWKETQEYKDWAGKKDEWSDEKLASEWDKYKEGLLESASGDVDSAQEAFGEEIAKLQEAMKSDTAIEGALSTLLAKEKSFEEREESFEAELAGAGGLRAIRMAMARIKRHEMTINLVTGVLKAGGASAGMFFPAAQAAGTLGDLIKTCDQLHQDIKALNDFTTSKTWAENANSHLLLPIKNFIENERHLIARDVAHMIFQFIQMGAKAAQAAGEPITVAAAKLTDAMAGSLDKGVDVIAWAVDKRTAQKAWEATAAALDDPGNRRLNLRALRMNSSLGKYALAYGATVQRHPVARQIVSKVGGLTPEDFMVETNKREDMCKELFGLLQTKYDRHVQVKHRLKEQQEQSDPTWADKLSLSTDPGSWTRLRAVLIEQKLEVDLSPVVRQADKFRRDRVAVRDSVNDVLEELLTSREKLERMSETARERDIARQRKLMLTMKADLTAFRSLCDLVEVGLAQVNRNLKAACSSHTLSDGTTIPVETVKANIRAGNLLGDKIAIVQEDAVIARDLAQDHDELINRRLEYLDKEKSEDILKAFEKLDEKDLAQAIRKVKEMIG